MCWGRMSHNSKLAFTFSPLGFSCLRQLGIWISHFSYTLFICIFKWFIQPFFEPTCALWGSKFNHPSSMWKKYSACCRNCSFRSRPTGEGTRVYIDQYTSVSHIHGPVPPKLSQWICNRRRTVHSCCLFHRPLGVGTRHLDDIRIIHHNKKVVCIYLWHHNMENKC